ncbi:NADPH-dependent F420 reductase [Georgenia wangjunii]|uniref:NADPH-dependent F420 reductase n=1 Tax=Georgenia wangjunii TaxID=3117730 RepID=UPI002F26A7F4
MKIGIIGAGAIGSTLAQRLSAAGHDVTIANSRGPETIDPATLSTGATAAWAAEVVTGADVVIVSVNLGQVPDVATLIHQAPAAAVIIDTSNYYPLRDGIIEAIENGEVESLWVQDHYQRPVAKAWNSIVSTSFADKATKPGSLDRIALPVAADDAAHRTLAMALVEDTGFDAFDAGTLTDSWRQQPGTPAYCTDLTADPLSSALAKADARYSARRRDLVWEVVSERAAAEGTVQGNYLVALNRAIY